MSDELCEGDRVEVTVGAPAHGGHCVARIGGPHGQVVFVRHALPGERVLVLRQRHGWSRVRLPQQRGDYFRTGIVGWVPTRQLSTTAPPRPSGARHGAARQAAAGATALLARGATIEGIRVTVDGFGFAVLALA